MKKSLKALYKMRYLPLLLVPLLVTMMVLPGTLIAAEPTVNLKTTSNFAILAGETITNSGATTISGSSGGDVGLYAGSAVTGFDPPPAANSVTMTGTLHVSDSVASTAKTDLVDVFNDAAGRTQTAPTFTGNDSLTGKTLTTGVYKFGSGSTDLSGTLTLDAQGNDDAVFIFQASSSLITGSGSKVELINGARFCRVFWVVPSSATLNSGSTFVGHIFAQTSISVSSGVTVYGQLLAQTGAVTLIGDAITNGPCPTTTTTTTTSPPAAAPAATTTTTASSGTLTVYKVDSSGNPIVAASQASVADFDIYANEADIAANRPFQKGSTGIGTNSFSTSLQNGTYYVVEKSAPEGYDIDGVVRSVTISGESVSLTFADTTIEVAAEEVTTTTTTPVTVTSTVTGGQLPKTGTPWYNVLLIGIILMLIGAGVWITRKVYERRSKT